MEPPVDPRYWTSLEDLAEKAAPGSGLRAPSKGLSRGARSPEPGAASEASDARRATLAASSVDRRAFLKLAMTSLAAGALSGCRQPVERIIPHLIQPVEVLPAAASWYATTCHGCSAGCGVLAKVVDGRPIKFEGNPDHGISRGGLCATGQAAVLGLYDDYRQKTPAIGGQPATWDEVDREVGRHLSAARQKRSGKLVLLTGTLTGPATRAVIRDFLATFPKGEQVVCDPLSYDAIRDAHANAYGEPIIPGYRFDRADVIVSFGADFLGAWLSPVEFTRQYAAGRRPDGEDARMSRHYQFEARLSLTGSNADVRVPVAPSEQAPSLVALAILVARGLQTMPEARTLAEEELPPLPAGVEPHVAAAAHELLAARGRGLVVADSPAVEVQQGVLAINELLGNTGHTVDLQRPSRQKQGRPGSIARLVREIERGEVAALLIHGCNPAYTDPLADAFVAALRSVPCVVSFATVPDETARAATYHCPTHHPMESWGDAEPQLGRFSLFQPTIRPLYDTRAFEESLLRWSGRGGTFYDALRRHWETEIFPRQQEEERFTAFWDGMLQRGYLELPVKGGSRFSVLGSWLKRTAGPSLPLTLTENRDPRPENRHDVEIELFEPVALRDGAAANNPWLQELPDPITKIAWDNAALIGPELARERGIREGQWIEVRAGDRTLRLPAHIQPGQHARTISVALGYGRTAAGPVGNGVGVNAFPLRADDPAALHGTLAAAPGARPHRFARTQIHDSMEGRPIVKETTFARHRQGDAGFERHPQDHADLWGEHETSEYRWGMVIDLTKCVGCSACVTACDIENNIPVVGREEVAQQREMHWLRIDRYYSGDPQAPSVTHQPMLCQHCANATCEVVCPVLATVHDDQGLNTQIYNRCVGTRYCANNCPYKVRRFNFWENVGNDLTRNLLLNPDVTARSRGIMEKCSFCIQRIQAARIAARREGRPIADGEVRTACEQSCPAGAILFGNLADPDSRVSKAAAAGRGYRVLEELNRRPAVHYLARVWNRDEQNG